MRKMPSPRRPTRAPGRVVAGISFDREVFAVIEERRGYEPRSSLVNRLLRRALRFPSEETTSDAAA